MTPARQSCGGIGTQYNGFTWTSAGGTVHSFGTVGTVQPQQGQDCGQPAASGYATDSSGYYISISNYTQATVWDRNGTEVYSSASPGTYEDSNGNYFATNSNGDLVDTLGRTPIATTQNCGLGETQTCYDVLNAQGGTSRYQVAWEAISVGTLFDESGVTEYQGTISVIRSIELPDGTQYQFTYDTNPPYYSGYGELLSVSFPTGGQNTYTYANYTDSAGNVNRWIATDTEEGNKWTYTASNPSLCQFYNNCNQVVVGVPGEPGGTITYTFGISDPGAWSTEAQYESGSTVLKTLTMAWDTGKQVKTTETTSYPTPTGSGTIDATTEWSNFDACGDPGQTSEWNFYSGSLPSSAYRVTTTTFTSESGSFANIPCLPSSTTVQVSGSTVSETNTTYDSTALSGTTGVAHHDDTNYGATNAVRGNPTEIQRLVSGSTYVTTTLAYDTTGQLVSTQDPNGNTTTFSYADSFYNDNGSNPPSSYTPAAATNAYLTEVSPPNVNGVSHASHFGYYYGTGEKAVSEDPNSQLTYFHYVDPFSRPTETAFPDGGWNLTAYTSETQTDTYTGVQTGASPSPSCSGCKHDETVLDSWGRPVDRDVANDPGGATTTAITYDGVGRIYKVTNPYRSGDSTYSTTYSYDPLSRVTGITRQDGNALSITYSPYIGQQYGADSQLCPTSTYGIGNPAYRVDEASDRSQVWTDAFGRVIEADQPTSPTGSFQATCYIYDGNNNLAQVVSPNGAARSFTYDDLSRLASVATPEGGTVTYGYDGDGNVTTRVAPEENQTNPSTTVTTTYTYDALNRLTEKSYSDSTTPTAYYAYDQSSAWGLTITNPIGRMTTAYTVPPGSQSAQTSDVFEYDPMGRVTTAEECQPQNCTNAPALAEAVGYDLAGDTTSLQEQDLSGAFNFTLTKTFNNIAQLMKITSSWNDSTHPATLYNNATYSAAGQRTGDTLGNGIAETLQYNSRLWPTSVTAGSVYSLSLGYGGTGDVTTDDDGVNGNFQVRSDFVHRLSSVQSSPPQSATGCDYLTWQYDSVGNRTAENPDGGTCPSSSLGYNTNNQVVTPSGYQYDAAGNMTNDSVHSYTYDAEGRMLTVDSGGTATYVYDAFGRRIEKTTGSGSFVYLYDPAGHQVAEVDTSGNNVEDDIWAGPRHLAMYYSNSTYFFSADQVGTERVATDPTGAVAQTCINMPYGDDFSCTGSLPTGFFAGYDFDSETALYHSPARYYSPALGRFMNPDPLASSSSRLPSAALSNPQQFHGYAYALNNPAGVTDPLGLRPILPPRRYLKLGPVHVPVVVEPPAPQVHNTPFGRVGAYTPQQLFSFDVQQFIAEWRSMRLIGLTYPGNGFSSACQFFSVFSSIAGGVPPGWLSPVPEACSNQFKIPLGSGYLQALEYIQLYYLSISSNGFFAASPDLQLGLAAYTGEFGSIGSLSGTNGSLDFAVDFGFPSFDMGMFFGGGGGGMNGCQIWEACSL